MSAIESDIYSRLIPVVRTALGIGAALFVALFVYTSASHLAYPYELEWMEGSMVDHVHRLLRGEQIYVPPSVEFAPHGYPLVYFYVSALFAQVLGIGFLPLRLVSALATLGTFALCFALVRRETGSRFAGLLAAGACAATYPLSGAFFDAARIDALSVCIFLGAIYLIRFAPSPRRAAIAGAVYGLSYLTKQVSLLFLPAVLIHLFVFRRKHLLPFLGAALTVAVGTTLVMDAFHDGWYSFYTFWFQTGRGINWPWLLPNLVRDFGLTAIAALFTAWFLLARTAWARDRDAALFWFLLFGATLAGSCISRALALGAFINVLMPGFVFLAMGLALGTHEALQNARQLISAAAPRMLTLFVLLACTLQFSLLIYSPGVYRPSRADREAGDGLIEWISQQSGEVFLVGHGFLPTYAGQPSHVHCVGIIDALFHPRTRPYIVASVTEALESRRFEWVVLSTPWQHQEWFQSALDANYTLEREFFDAPKVFMPVTGMKARPTFVYKRR